MGFITQKNINNPAINYGNLIDPMNTKPSGFDESSIPYKFQDSDRYENIISNVKDSKSVYNPAAIQDPKNPYKLEKLYNDSAIAKNLETVRKDGLDKLTSKYSVNIISQKYKPTEKVESPFELIKEGKFDELRKMSSKFDGITHASKPGEKNNQSIQDIDIVQESIDKYFRDDFVIPVELNKNSTITRNVYDSPFTKSETIQVGIDETQNIIDQPEQYIGDELETTVQERILKYDLNSILDAKLGDSKFYQEFDKYDTTQSFIQEVEVDTDYETVEVSKTKSTLRSLIENVFKYDTTSSDIIRQLSTKEYSDDVLDLPLSGDNLKNIVKTLDEIINTSSLEGRHEVSDIVNILAKDINNVIVNELNSLYDFTKAPSVDYWGRRFLQFNNDHSITQFDDSSLLDNPDVFNVVEVFGKRFTPFILPYQTEYSDINSLFDKADDTVIVDYMSNKFATGFTYKQFLTSYNLEEYSLYGIGDEVVPVDHFTNVNSRGFVPNTPSLSSYFNFDSSTLDIKSPTGIDEVDYFLNSYNSGFTSNPLLLATEFINETSLYGFGSQAPSVNYIDNRYNSGFTQFPRPLFTEFINESSLLDFNGPLPDGVDFFFNNWNTGFTINPTLLYSEYKNESSLLDLGSFGFNVNYFRDNWNTGFTLNPTLLQTEYKVDSSLLDLGSFGDSVDFFTNVNGKGFTLNPVLLESDYVFNSSIFDFDGELPDNGVDYFDVSRSNTRKGFIQRMIDSDYINETSLFGFTGPVGDSVDFISNDFNSGFTTKIPSLLSEFINKSDLGFDEPSGVDFFRQSTTGFTLRQNVSEFLDDSSYDNVENHIDNSIDKYDGKESRYSTEDRAIRFQKNPSFRFTALNYNAVNYINNLVTSNLTGLPLELSQDQFELQSQVKQSSYKVDGSIISPSLIKTVTQDYFYPDYRIKEDYSNLGETLESWEDDNGIKGQYWRTDSKTTRQRIDEIYDKFNLRDSSFGGNQPFIIRGIQNPQNVSENIDWMDKVVDKNPYITGGDDIIRGGIVTHNVRTLYDTKRIGDFLQTPTGLRYLVNQQLLQTINPSVETAPGGGANTGVGILDDILDIAQEIFIGDRPTQRFNPLSVIAQVKSGMDGAKTTRHGVGDPYSKQGQYGEVTKERNKLTNALFSSTTGLQLSDVDASKRLGDQGNHNRLLMLAAELFPTHMTAASFPSPPPPTPGTSGGGSFLGDLLDFGADVLTSLGRGLLNSLNLPFQLGGFSEMLFGGYEGQPINKLSQVNGGPHSRLGVGATIIHRQANSFNFNPDNINQLNFSDKQYASFLNGTRFWRGQLSKNNDKSGLTDLDSFDSTHKKAGFEQLIKDSTLAPHINYLQYEDPQSSQMLETGKLFNIFRRYAGFDVGSNLTLIDTSKDERKVIQRNRFVWDGTNGSIGPVQLSPVINQQEAYRIQSLFKTYTESPDQYNEVYHNTPEQDRKTHVSPKSRTGLGSYLTVVYPQLNKIQEKLAQERGNGYVHDFRQTIIEGESYDVPNVETRKDNDISISPQPQWKLLMTDSDVVNLDNDNREIKFGEGIQGRTNGPNGGLIDRSNPIDIELPNTGNGKINDAEWKKIQKISRGDKINLINFLKKTSATDDLDLYAKATGTNGTGKEVRDFVRFYFSTIDYWPGTGAGDIIPFRAVFDGGISDSFSGNWSDQTIMGRGDSAAMYNGFNRSVSFSFSLFPSSREEMWSNWRKVNMLTSWTAPDFGDDGNAKMKGPVIRLTIGDLYVGVPCYMTSCQLSFDETGGWETGNLKDDLKQGTLQLPKYINVSVSLTIIGNYRPQKNGYMYELNSRGRGKDISWLDPEEMDY